MGGVEYSVRDGIAYVTLDRPEVLNALDVAAKRRLAWAWAQAEEDPQVRVVVLSGRGPSFCSGSDLKEIAASGPADTETVLAALPNVIVPLTKPTVAALHGHVLGMGLNLALHCDIRFAAPETTLGFPEIRHGMISAAGAIVLASVAPYTRAAEMLLLGDSVTADEALQLGLLSRLAQDPLRDATGVARRIQEHGPAAVAATLRLARLGAGLVTQSLVAEIRSVRDRLDRSVDEARPAAGSPTHDMDE